MTDDLERIRAHATERERHFRISAYLPSSFDERKMLRAAHADVEALLAALREATAPDHCPFCRSSVVALIKDPDGQLVLCKTCGGRGPSCETEAEAWAAWRRRP